MAHPKTGGFLPVPNVQALAQTWNSSGELVPDRYVRTEEAVAEEVVAGCALPVVDLGRLLDPRSSAEELANLGSACQHWSYFQLVNHGVPEEVIRDVRRDIAEFFKLLLEAKKACAQLPDDIQGYGQGFVFSETQKLDWADMIYLKLRPMESRSMRFWPAQLSVLQELRGLVLDGGGEGDVVLAAVDGGGHGRGAGAPPGEVRGPAADHEGDLPAVQAGRRCAQPVAAHGRLRRDAAAPRQRCAGPAN